MGEFGRRRNWTREKLDVGKFERGRVWRWANLDVGEFGHGRILEMGEFGGGGVQTILVNASLATVFTGSLFQDGIIGNSVKGYLGQVLRLSCFGNSAIAML